MRAENYFARFFVHIIYLRKCVVVLKRNSRSAHVPES